MPSCDDSHSTTTLGTPALLDENVKAESSSLIAAIRRGAIDEVGALLKQGQDPNAPDALDDAALPPDELPLHIAAARGHVEIVALLLEHGATIDAEHLRRAPLACAAGGIQAFPVGDSHLATARLLLEKGADPRRGSVLLEAVKSGYVPMVDLVLTAGAALSPNGAEIEFAADRGNADVARRLAAYLHERGDAAAAAKQLGMALLAAARAGHANVAAVLLEGGADVNALDDSKKTALHWNAMWGKRDRMRLFEVLHAAGADLDRLDVDGVCPLVYAVAGGFTDLVHALLNAGARVHPENAFPPLFQAAYDGKPELVEILLAAGADPTASYDGKRAVDWARSRRHTALARRLEPSEPT